MAGVAVRRSSRTPKQRSLSGDDEELQRVLRESVTQSQVGTPEPESTTRDDVAGDIGRRGNSGAVVDDDGGKIEPPQVAPNVVSGGQCDRVGQSQGISDVQEPQCDTKSSSETIRRFRRKWGKAPHTPPAYKLVSEEEFDTVYLDEHARRFSSRLVRCVEDEMRSLDEAVVTPAVLFKLIAGPFFSVLRKNTNSALDKSGLDMVSETAWCKFLSYLISTFIVGVSCARGDQFALQGLLQGVGNDFPRVRFEQVLSRLKTQSVPPTPRQMDDRTAAVAGVPVLEGLLSKQFSKFWFPECYYALDDSKWKTKSTNIPGKTLKCVRVRLVALTGYNTVQMMGNESRGLVWDRLVDPLFGVCVGLRARLPSRGGVHENVKMLVSNANAWYLEHDSRGGTRFVIADRGYTSTNMNGILTERGCAPLGVCRMSDRRHPFLATLLSFQFPSSGSRGARLCSVCKKPGHTKKGCQVTHGDWVAVVRLTKYVGNTR